MVFPMSTMIRDAVIHIRQRNGSSLAEIRKHLEATHNKKLDGINKKILTSTLTGLVQTRQLQKKGSNYKLAGWKAVIPKKDVLRRHRHCPRPFRYRRAPRRRRRSRRRRRHHRRRRRHHRRRSRRRVHHHCNPYRYKYRVNRAVNRSGHRHCPRR